MFLSISKLKQNSVLRSLYDLSDGEEKNTFTISNADALQEFKGGGENDKSCEGEFVAELCRMVDGWN